MNAAARILRRACVASLVVVGLGPAACQPCRTVPTTTLSFACDAVSAFSGEIHIDSASAFTSFLQDECAPSLDDASVTALVTSVDFTRDVVFVATGAADDGARCIAARRTDEVAVCADGLHLEFDDDIAPTGACGSMWTVAFSLARADLRAALDAP